MAKIIINRDWVEAAAREINDYTMDLATHSPCLLHEEGVIGIIGGLINKHFELSNSYHVWFAQIKKIGELETKVAEREKEIDSLNQNLENRWETIGQLEAESARHKDTAKWQAQTIADLLKRNADMMRRNEELVPYAPKAYHADKISCLEKENAKLNKDLDATERALASAKDKILRAYKELLP